MKPTLFLFIIFLFALSGCAHQTLTPAIHDARIYQQQLAQLNQWQLEGKIAVRHANKSDSASVRWQQDKNHFDIFLSGPLGAGATRLTGTPEQLIIQNNSEEKTSTSNPEQLIEKHLGWTLPIDQLPKWILGWSNSSNTHFNIDHTLKNFTELDWQVEYQTYQNVGQWLLPAKIMLKHEDMQVTIVIKRWDIH